MSTPQPPADLVDGLHATVEKDGRVKFALMRKRKAFAHLTLAGQPGRREVAANALGGAYDAHDQALMGLVPPARARSTSSCALAGLGLGPCTIEDHRLFVVHVGASRSSASPSPSKSSKSSASGWQLPRILECVIVTGRHVKERRGLSLIFRRRRIQQ